MKHDALLAAPPSGGPAGYACDQEGMCKLHFQELWSKVIECVQDGRLSVGDCYRLKHLLLTFECRCVRAHSPEVEGASNEKEGGESA